MRVTHERMVWGLRLTALCLAVTSGMALTQIARAEDKDDDSGASTGGWTDSMSTSVKDAIVGAKRKIGLDKPPAPPIAEAPSGCPTIGILPGTEAQRIMAPGASGNQGLRHQYSLLNVGRECGIAGDRVTIKVGADGRVLLGPAGAAGHFDVPIRIAVFNLAQQKPVESRLFKVPVNVPAGQSAASFDFVSDAITVSIPQGRSGDYNIKVGIDTGKSGAETPVKAKHARRQKASPTQSASR